MHPSDPAGEVTRHLRSLEARGSQTLVAQLIDSLMSDSSSQMEAMRRAATSGDREGLYRSAHSLQGSVAIVGGESVAGACAELVKTARDGSFEQIGPLVDQIESGVEAIRRALVGWESERGLREPFSTTAEPENGSRSLSIREARARHRR